MASHGKDMYFSIEDSAASTLRNISPDVTDVQFGRGNDVHDTTTAGAEGHTWQVGLTDQTITVTVLYSITASTGTATVFDSLVGLEVTVGFEWGPNGNGTGSVKYSGECVLESWETSSPVADLITGVASLKVSGDVTKGTFA